MTLASTGAHQGPEKVEASLQVTHHTARRVEVHHLVVTFGGQGLKIHHNITNCLQKNKETLICLSHKESSGANLQKLHVVTIESLVGYKELLRSREFVPEKKKKSRLVLHLDFANIRVLKARYVLD